MDGLGRPAPFPSVGAGAGPIVPPPHGIVFGRAAAGAAAHPVQNGGSNRNVSPSRNRKVPPVAAKQQQPVPKQQQTAPPNASVKNSELLREEQAKARRLLRFAQAGDKPDSASGRFEERGVSNRELRQPKGELVVRQTRAEAPRRPQGKLVDFAAHDEAMEMEGPEALGDDFRNVEAIIGTCTDMCPEPERQERERKGDLDRFERVDGDRNLTSVNLAVKKYTRTASREPPLIRPLPVLQMTMDHLLTLINQGYSEELLKIHSFLWDRMRAVRMDLRMQHIFNREAITMHEQMIRFHILAMHELCEFAKGEGFNEGFDAHLNIEQMNKASVDLFEMYDDHRKRGIPVPTEAEFRGYYALLKLDKHPGYSVEPAELSLDLAKMTSEMRNTPQVLFAREVARACRGGNYIAFFRLARKATYLQACLMHAHFSKVRTEALAVLHSGLQRNQSIPIMVVTKWLAMEGEDIEALMEYHGFAIKVFEKTYAVKEGPFLNRDAPYHAQRSRLVEAKRSLKVELDVEGQGQDQAVADSWTVTPTTPVIHEEEMPDYEDDDLQSPEESKEEETWENTVGRGFLGTSPGHQEIQTVGESRVSPTVKAASPSPGVLPEVLLQAKFPFGIRSAWPAARKSSPGVNSSTETNLWRGSMHKTHSAPIQKEFGLDVEESDAEVEEDDDDMPESHPTTEELRAKRALEWEVEKEEAREKDREQERRRRLTEEAEAAAAKWAAKQAAAAEAKRLEAEERKLASHRSEASAGRMRLWLRRWKRRATFRAEEKVRRRKKAEAALSSLSAGPALVSSQLSRDMVLTSKTEPILSVTSLSQVARERGDKLWEMWRPLDIASVVIPIFEQRIPVPRFITFKLLLSVGEPNASNSAGQWLHTKLSGRQLLPPEGDSLGFWFEAKDMDLSREKLGVTDGYGASGVVFLLQEGRPISEERARLLAVVQSLPVGAQVPLLLVFTPQRDTFRNEEHRFRGSLGLEDLDRTRIACHYISPTFVKSHGNTLAGRGLYSDHYLKEGLVWLANNMPSQPNLVCQHIRDVVLNNLDGHLKLLSVTAASKVSPERCVLTFNHALESAMSRIRSAVDSAPPHWPPPEVDAEVNGLLSQVLPRQGWNDPVNLDPIFTALRLAQLPPFPTMKQLRPGSPTSDWENVRHQKAIVEHSLRQYLGLLDGTGQESAATIRQAQLMVQRACSLEWTASGRVLVPRWASIFQAVYQARLLLLNSEPPPIVFVLAAETEHHLELDDFEQSIPFANDIVAGSSFAFPPHASLILNDFVEKPEVEPRSNHNGSTEPFGRLGPELEGTREEPLISYRTERDAGISSPGCGWSVSSTSPNDDIRQVHQGKLRRQPTNDFFPNTLKKRKLTLSPEIIVNSVPTIDVKNSANESSVLLNHKHRFNSSQEMASNRGTLEDYEDNSFRVHRRLKLPLTAEEMEIENMVVKIQTDVDRSVRRASSDMCFADTLFTSDIQLAEGDSLSMDAAQSMTVNFHVEGAQERIRDVGNHLPSWTWLNGGVKDLEDLLIQCWRAQEGIDQKLGESFGLGL